MNIEEFITKLFGGWELSRVNFITNVLEKEGIHTVEQMKSLESNFWESLRGSTNFDANKTWSIDEIVEEAVAKALEGSHVSRINFFTELLKENLELADLMHFECEYLEALRKITMTEFYEIRRLVRKRFDVEHILCDVEYQLIDFEYEEALRVMTDKEIEKMPEKTAAFKYIKEIVTSIFENPHDSRIDSVTRYMEESCLRNIKNQTPAGMLDSDIDIIKGFVQKRLEMTIEEALAETFGDPEDTRINSIAGALKKYKDIYVVKDLISLNWKLEIWFRELKDVEFKKLRTHAEKIIEESVAEALENSGKLRINFVTKALMRDGLKKAHKFCEEAQEMNIETHLKIIQEFSCSEINNIMSFVFKSLKEVISEIMEGCDGSRIDFVTKALNKRGIWNQRHLIKRAGMVLENIEGLTEEEVNKIKAFIEKSRNNDMKKFLTEVVQIDDKQKMSYIISLMKEFTEFDEIRSLQKHLDFLEILLGFHDLEINKFREFIQVRLGGLTDVEINRIKGFLRKEVAIEAGITRALEGAHVSRINFFKDVLKDNFDVTDLKQLDNEYMDALKPLSKFEKHHIRNLILEMSETFEKDVRELLRASGNLDDVDDDGDDDDDDDGDDDDDFIETVMDALVFNDGFIDWELMTALPEMNDFERLMMFQKKDRQFSKFVEEVLKEIFKDVPSRIDVAAMISRWHGEVVQYMDYPYMKRNYSLSDYTMLSSSDIYRIKSYIEKRQEMTIEEALAEILEDSEDRIHYLADTLKKFKGIYMAKDLALEIGSITYLKRLGNKCIILKKYFEEKLQEAVSKALEDSSFLRIKFVTKALMRDGLGKAYGFFNFGNPLEVLQNLSDSEIAKMMVFVRKSLRDVISEILEGCDGSRIDFVTKALNKKGIWNQHHLIDSDWEFEESRSNFIEGLTDDEFNKIKAFLQRKNDFEDFVSKIFEITDDKRINFIARAICAHNIGSVSELLELNWESTEALMGLQDVEVKRFLAFIQKIQYVEPSKNKRKYQTSQSPDSSSTVKRRKVQKCLSCGSCLVEPSDSEEEPFDITTNHSISQQMNGPPTWKHLNGIECKLEILQNNFENRLNNVFIESAKITKILENMQHSLLELKNTVPDKAIDSAVMDKGQSNSIETSNNLFFMPSVGFEPQSTDSNAVVVVDRNNEINEILQCFQTPLAKQTNNMAELPDNVLLPIKTTEEFHSYEKKLNESYDFYKLLVKKLSLCGGSNVKEVINRILKNLLTHELSLKISWSGKVAGKLGFHGSKLMKAVIDAVRMNRETSSASDFECEVHMKSWLRNAPDRCGGRNNRRHKENALNC